MSPTADRRIRHPRNSERLYFWHIPKTAGTSFIAWLDQHYADESIYPEQLLSAVRQDPSPTTLTPFALVRGHLADAPLQLLDSPPCTVTILREPLRRATSHLAHVHRDENHPVHERLQFYAGDLDRALDDPVVRAMVHNTQSRYLGLSWRADLEDPFELVEPAHPLAGAMAFEFAPLPPSPRLLPRALRQLSRISYVGTTEQVDVLARRIARARGFRGPQIDRHNTRPRGKSPYQLGRLTPRQRQRLKELTRLDYVLWRAAQIRSRAAR